MTEKNYVPVSVVGPAREFHVTRAARKRYNFADRVFALQGHVIFSDIRAAREFSHRINTVRNAVLNPDKAIPAGDIYAMGLIDEILHYIVAKYREEIGAGVFKALRERLNDQLGEAALEETLLQFSDLFPTSAVYRETESVEESLSRTVEEVDGRDVATEEIILLWLDNRNPAYGPAMELFNEQDLKKRTLYDRFVAVTDSFFQEQPSFGPEKLPLIELLRQPALKHPNSLRDQLEYIKSEWGSMLGEFFDRLLRSLDIIQEEQRARFFGPGPAKTLEFGTFGGDDDQARFSPDKDWMPKVVLLAKSTLVWLDQLSRTYGREIRTLDAIPDEELDSIASRGFTGLWLIGLWQRSDASKRIKQMTGNPDAEASAYSLYDYDIADELGGWSAADKLRHRLWNRGVRLASDMVPNHVGIDGRWIYEHPDWFVQLDYPPFPGYDFNGADLSGRDGTGIFLEDHYYDRSDASVVFKHVDFGNGRERFIYHGNDGTSMPWNDTAQLNYLNPEVREAIIQTILHVARNFPIIRFDAAMTLAKKHIQRLWFPAPGQGGDIPSRAEHGLSQHDFDAAIPIEFWREVVDRVATEVPDTLLLAEAFWMMEGYFVRTLGMHRVYNSAFMNMLKNEDNGEYRRTIKNTIEYDPEVLKRYVNFMNNPDEETAVTQFGKDEKYFGVATLMVTMPGLPMFGHGQIEGFTEKYGMEYRRAYWDETPDQHLIERHHREIFPLMHKRYLFAESGSFRLYDFYDSSGNINENVFAYSNRSGSERALILYNNSYYQTNGWIQSSSPYVVFDESGERIQRRERLAEALGLPYDYNCFLIFREQRSDLWFIRNCGDLHDRGFYAELRGYESQVFLDLYDVYDTNYSHYARLADQLNGSGTPDVSYALKKIMLQPLHDAFAVIANSGTLRKVQAQLFPVRETSVAGKTARETAAKQLGEKYLSFLQIAAQFADFMEPLEPVRAEFDKLYLGLLKLAELPHGGSAASKALHIHLSGQNEDYSILMALLLLLPLEELVESGEEKPTAAGFHALDRAGDWQLIHELRLVFDQIQPDNPLPRDWEALLSVLLLHHGWPSYGKTVKEIVLHILDDESVRRFLDIHEYDGIVWFNREAFEEIRDWLFAVGLWYEASKHEKLPAKTRDLLYTYHKKIQQAERKSGYQLEKLIDAL